MPRLTPAYLIAAEWRLPHFNRRRTAAAKDLPDGPSFALPETPGR
jgi:hypothetical protein